MEIKTIQQYIVNKLTDLEREVAILKADLDEKEQTIKDLNGELDYVRKATDTVKRHLKRTEYGINLEIRNYKPDEISDLIFLDEFFDLEIPDDKE